MEVAIGVAEAEGKSGGGIGSSILKKLNAGSAQPGINDQDTGQDVDMSLA